MSDTSSRRSGTLVAFLERARTRLARGGRTAVAWAMTAVLALSTYLGILPPS